MAQSNQRLVLDLEEIERQLRQAQTQPPPPPKHDPLAELARIVGQDDPFRSVLAQPKPATYHRDDLFAHAPGDRHAGPQSAAEQDFYADAHSAEQSAPAAAHGSEESGYETADEAFRPLERHRSRKGLLTVGVILGTAVLGVVGALTFRSAPTLTATGEPPIIRADREPLKVQPENPGGVDIPNQNAQVYERGARDGQTRIVNREEQPVDVQQAAKSVQPAPAPSTATPGNVPAAPPPQLSSNSSTVGLGEPRRVRTVSVRPDGTVVAPDQAAPAPSLAPRAPSAPAMSMAPPPASVAAPGVTTTPAPQGSQTQGPRPRSEARPSTPAAQPNGSSQPAQARPTPPAASAAQNGAPLPITPQAPQQPQRARTAAAAQPDADASNPARATGGYVVQLSVLNSEADARSQAQALGRKYAGELSGRSPFVRSAEVNGKTLYRVRVGPMSQHDANELCTKLKSSGGSCFIAKN